MPKYAIFFRGDSRAPAERFESGFQPIKPTLGQPFETNNFAAGPNAVCVTGDLEVSAKFPLDSTEASWIYVIAIDTAQQDENQYLNFYERELPKVTDGDIVPFALMLYFTKEHLVDNISGSQILGAFPIQRKFLFDVHPRGTFFCFEMSGKLVCNEKSVVLLTQHPELQKELAEINQKYSKKDPISLKEFITQHEEIYLGEPGHMLLYRVAFYAKNKASPSSRLFANPEQMHQENRALLERISRGELDSQIMQEKKSLMPLVDKSFVKSFNLIDMKNHTDKQLVIDQLEKYFDPKHEKIPETFAYFKS